MKHSVFVV